MSPRTRVIALVASVAVAAAVAAVGATMLASSGSGPDEVARAGTRAGAPPLMLDLGVREDPEARALRRGARLYAAGRRTEAGRIFARFGSLEAAVGSALAGWPVGTVKRLDALGREHPNSAVVRLHLGLARFWLRQDRLALAAWRAAARVEPDSASAVRAGDLLHTDMADGLPTFVPSFDPPLALDRLSPSEQLEVLRRGARGVRGRLLYGVALQRLGKPLSARRQYDAAAAAAPRNAEAQVAAAVVRFEKDDPSRAFGRLGPLTRRFPHAPTVRFHLGLMLLWIGRVDEAREQLVRARALGPRSPLGREANRFLRRLESIGRTG